MFETAELGRTMPKAMYKKNEVALRQELLELQVRLREIDHSQVILVFAGVDGAGKGHTVSLLNEWMDPRWLTTCAFDEPADVERERPEFWRYWLALPPRGRIGLFLGSWYSKPVLDHVYGRTDDKEFDRRLDRIIAFERALADDEAVIVKFWMHLSREAQKTRLKNLEAEPLERARVTDRDWRHWEMYDDFVKSAERVIMRTSTGAAPWHIVEGVDPYYRSMTIGTTLRDTLRRRIDEIELDARIKQQLKAPTTEEPEAPAGPGKSAPKKSKVKSKHGKKVKSASRVPDPGQPAESPEAQAPAGAQELKPVTVLSQLDMSKSLTKAEYTERLREQQAKLHLFHRETRDRGISTILVFEGPDAAGKGGAIRRLNAAFDARNYQVHGFSAPTDEERAQHYLWRFWRHLSRAGRISTFDRSWYGRVLVERVEGFATENEWRRAYAEINDFESQLIEHGIVLVKYWVHVSNEEQLERFRQRELTPYKRWKITEEDWRNRGKWDEYDLAVNDMVQYTSTYDAPWTLVEGNDKRYARVKVLETLCARMEKALEKTRANAAESASGGSEAGLDPVAPSSSFG